MRVEDEVVGLRMGLEELERRFGRLRGVIVVHEEVVGFEEEEVNCVR